MPLAILEYDERHPLELKHFASGEAQVAAIADDIAYDAHDIDDGTRSGLLDAQNLREVGFSASFSTPSRMRRRSSRCPAS